MPKTAPRTKTKRAAAPRADRPNIPYGIQGPKEGLGLLPWSRAVDRLRASYVYWIGTADDRGPHAVPVWGVWLDGTLYFSNGENTRTGRALASNGRVAVHLESGEDAVMLEGGGGAHQREAPRAGRSTPPMPRSTSSGRAWTGGTPFARAWRSRSWRRASGWGRRASTPGALRAGRLEDERGVDYRTGGAPVLRVSYGCLR